MSEIKTFKDLGLSDEIVEALKKKGFEKPTPIQAETIPHLLNDTRDIIGQAQTGTGKTAAFGLPILDKLEEGSPNIKALILAPTRELAIQVSDELNSLKGSKRLKIVPIYGGQSIDKQIQQLRQNVDVVVGTPGRVIDHLRNKKIDFSKIKYLVLDEADEMLNIGFKEDIEKILATTNDTKQTLLFSATMPAPIQRIAEKYMKEHVVVRTKKIELDQSLTEQFYYEFRESERLEALCRIIDVENNFHGFIFCRTKRDVENVAERLIDRGYSVEAMHGDLSQHQRERVLHKFKRKNCNILVVTDVAARGIDVNDLTHVINYAIPQDAESYTHRVGRTGRAGKKGIAITFISSAEFRKLNTIQKITKFDIKKGELPDVKDLIKIKRNKIQSDLNELAEKGLEDNFINFSKQILESQDPTLAVASLLKMAFKRELDEKTYSHINTKSKQSTFDSGSYSDRSSRSRGPRDRAGDRDRGGDRNERFRSPRKSSSRESFGGNSSESGDKTRLFIAKGKLDDMNPRKLVQFIEQKSDVFGKRIDEVKVFDKFSFVTVTYNDAEQIVDAFKDGGRRSLVEIAKK